MGAVFALKNNGFSVAGFERFLVYFNHSFRRFNRGAVLVVIMSLRTHKNQAGKKYLPVILGVACLNRVFKFSSFILILY